MLLRRIFFLAVFSCALTLSACCSRPPAPTPRPAPSYVVLLESPDGTTGQVVVSGSKGTQVLNQAKTGVSLDGSLPPQFVPDALIERDFGAAMAARPMLPKRFLLYFEAGGTRLTDESMALIPQILAETGRRLKPDVSIIGHTDTVGDPERNTHLALSRARAVAEVLTREGLQAHALSIESHGERNLLVQTPDETPEPRNRRVEVSLR